MELSGRGVQGCIRPWGPSPAQKEREKEREGGGRKEGRNKGSKEQRKPLRVIQNFLPNLAVSENPLATRERLSERSLHAGCLEARMLMHLMGSGSCFHIYSVWKDELNQEKGRRKEQVHSFKVKKLISKQEDRERDHIFIQYA